MTNHQNLINDLSMELKQSLHYLEYSYNKITSNKLSATGKDPETLETWEALVSRFARTTDIFIAKYLRAIAELDDPAFRGSLRDWVNYSEKKGIIDSAQNWLEIRELRNKIAHEYAINDLSGLFQQVLGATPSVLKIKDILK